MQKVTLFFCLIVVCFGCGTSSKKAVNPVAGLWRVELDITEENKSIPFFLEIIEEQSALKAAIWNGHERIVHDDVRLVGDSLFLESPYFNSSFLLKHDKNILEGIWVDHSRGDYQVPVKAKYNLSERFRFKGPMVSDADGKWEVRFSPNSDDEYKAIGLFETDENSMKGTFITETGDYRFLDGGFGGDQLKLSTFDGSHAFLFEADLVNDTLRGWFWSGKHWKEPFVAWRNDSINLADPYAMTALTNPDEPISFSFKDMDGQMVSIDDEEFRNKPVLVQIMGSWCPNCMDEAAFLAAQQDYLEEAGVKVIGLSFERLEYEEARGPLLKLQGSLNLNYPILYAGKANKKEATKSVPWLKEIKSYPTLLFVLPNRKVFRIHTGFYGPGTGPYFEKQSTEMFDDIRKLIELSKTQATL
ncbi:MAG: TlpA family protein disulfide reductase [Bacteroidia bacterium]|nr:TlpA family protein disulfide reductase [Bacteroidia bacterium]